MMCGFWLLVFGFFLIVQKGERKEGTVPALSHSSAWYQTTQGGEQEQGGPEKSSQSPGCVITIIILL